MSQTMMPPGGAPPDAAPPPAAPDDAGGSESNVVLTITSDGQGGYVVFPGDEPDDDAGAGAAPVGGAPDEGASQGQPASSIGEALKAAMMIMQQAESAGPGGSAEDQFTGGFSGAQDQG